MKGVIVDYFEDKGFGFIVDENEDKRFFHITNIHRKDVFLENLTDYYYTDWVERKCFVVEFNPSQNHKGLNATEIKLTKQVLNDKKSTADFEAIITDFRYDTASLTRIMSGISKGMSKPLGATAGGNGTYRIGYPEVIKDLNIYFRRIDDIGWGAIDVRDVALSVNNRSKVTSKFVSEIGDNIVGKIIKVSSGKKVDFKG